MLSLGLGLSITSPEQASGFSPSSLFAAGEAGYWYDPSDLTTLFQDTAGTTPVTAAGQSVARINDKSGRGYHATQAATASRPTYQVDGVGRGYLSFDGVDDAMVIPTLPLTGSEELYLCFGVQRLSTINNTTLFTFGKGGNTTSYPGFNLQVVGNSVPTYSIRMQTSSNVGQTGLIGQAANSFGNAAARVVSGTRTALRIDGSSIPIAGSVGAYSGFGTQNNRLGCNYNFANNAFWYGYMFGVIARFSVVTDSSTITKTERWIGGEMGKATA